MQKTFEKDQILKMFGERAKSIRLKKGLRQIDIANRCHISKSNFNGIELGKRNITIMTLLKIADALEEPVESFFVNWKN